MIFEKPPKIKGFCPKKADYLRGSGEKIPKNRNFFVDKVIPKVYNRIVKNNF